MVKGEIVNKEPELQIPRIPVEISKKGDALVIKCRDKKARFFTIDDSKNTYDLVSIEQFITKIAQYEYGLIVNEQKEERQKAQKKAEFRNSFLANRDQANEETLVNMLLENAGYGKEKKK